MNKQQLKLKEKRTESLMVTLFSLLNSGDYTSAMIQELKDQLESLGVKL